MAQQGLLNGISGRKSSHPKAEEKGYVIYGRNTVQKIFLYPNGSIFNNALFF